MGRRINHDRRDLPPNLYVRNDGYYSYRDPRNGKEYGLGRDRRLAVSEAIQVNIELLADAGRISLSARISQVDSVTFHSWLERYEKIIAARGLKQKILIDYASKLRSIEERVQDIPIAEITTRQIAMILNDYANEGKPVSCPDSIFLVNHQAFMSCVACRQGCMENRLETVLRSIY